ncbi:MAG: hypothetical protein DRO87_04235 [Candidatus Thorarchaeota archaeon]|nr:MAG: hypothetical protein DRP09_09335 [Candidatus Thorarchaeota archaeon]RLI58972.1 MAG: hypothetical protein DRO87_04235 [Candidatus Thorarchaeota archaeon]
MQQGIIGLTIAFQFFLFVGYMFYLLFRIYAEEDSPIAHVIHRSATRTADIRYSPCGSSNDIRRARE